MSSPQSSVPIPLSNWIQRARVCLSRDDYLLCAIKISLALTNRLRHIVGLSFRIEDIVSENVLVFVQKNNTRDFSSPDNLIATEVKIIRSNAKDSELSDVFETPQLSQRDACFVIGKILFEMLSESNSQFLDEIGLQNNEESLGNLHIGGTDSNGQSNGAPTNMLGDVERDDPEDISLPELKRAFIFSTTHGNSSTKSIKANEYLQSQNLPPSIIQLVSDLLDAEEGNHFVPDTALLSLEEVQHDLLQVKSHPEWFLDYHSWPSKALDHTALFDQGEEVLYGRDKELGILAKMATRVHLHVPSPERKDFLCEASFISGHSGSGKSSIIKRMVSYGNTNNWSVIFCKFDRQVSPLSILIQSFDAYFGKFIPIQDGMADGINLPREPSVQDTFDRISRSIISSVDNDGFFQLCQLLPSFSQLFPMASKYAHHRNTQPGSVVSQDDSLASAMNQTAQASNASSAGNVGSGRNRLLHLLHIVMKAVCAGGYPVLVCAEDLQWADAFTVDVIGDYIVQTAEYYSSVFSSNDKSIGMMLLGSFRDDEVPEDGFLMDKIKLLEITQGNINVTRLSIGELTEQDIHEMLSFKFCLPMRHTRELAQLVYLKTRGHPLFFVSFLQSMIRGNIISFSVKARRWTWDETAIDLQMISEGVVEFLTKKLKQLPNDVVETLKVASCFGQVNMSTIQLLDSGQFVHNMLGALDLAVKEGIVEKAGPIFAFSHDMLQESTYNLIPVDDRNLFHKKIGMCLVQDPEVAENAELCTLAVDQINICKGDLVGILDDPAECSLFARLNLAAGKHFMSTRKFNYEQAQAYFEAGISLLHADHWDKQYSLSLELYECSVVVSFKGGIVDTVSSRLDDILSNARSFDDTLNSRVLLAKFLASQEQYADATRGVLDVLSNLGEAFPTEISESLVIDETNEIVPVLTGITKDKIQGLPAMTDTTKLHAMRFMDLLTAFSNFSSPMLLHLVSCRMTKLTFSFGFCREYSITGLVYISHALLQYSNDNIWLASQITRTAESLMIGNPNEHSFRARLAVYISSVLLFVEPGQACFERILGGYTSATAEGDLDNAMYCGLLYWGSSIFITPDLFGGQTSLGNLLLQTAKHKRINLLRSSMSYYNAYTAFIGNHLDVGIEMKTNSELYHIAEETQNSYLMHQVILNLSLVHCYFREYQHCVNLAEKYQISRTAKRTNDFLIAFYGGISALNLARDKKQEKWRKMGEEALQFMSRLVEYSTWNFKNKQCLLQAEVHNLNGHYEMAELAYQASITYARDHKFIMEEALANELFGLFLLENKDAEKGMEHLKNAYNKYKQWGALKKAEAVKDYIYLVNATKDVIFDIEI